MLEYKEENYLNAYLELFDLDSVIIVKIPLKDTNLCKLQIKMVLENGWIEVDDTPPFDNNKLYFFTEPFDQQQVNSLKEDYKVYEQRKKKLL